MEQFLLPEPLKNGNLAEGWEKFKREFTQFLVATEKTKVKTGILLRVIVAEFIYLSSL